MNSGIDKFKNYAVVRGGLYLFPDDIAIDVIRELENKRSRILGLDGFVLTETTTEPHLEHTLDLSGSERGWSQAREFLRARKGLGLLFEIVADD